MGNENKTVLLFGSSGMLGQELCKVFSISPYKLIPLSSKDIDISNRKAVLEVIQTHKPDIILNSAAKVNVDQCEKDPSLAESVNALAPGYIAQALQKITKSDAIFVHFSSSDIFGSRFDETPDEKEGKMNPVNVYGRTKLEGENWVKSICETETKRWYVIRSSWIYSEFKKTFVDAIAEHIKNKNGFMSLATDQRGVPTWSKEIAGCTLGLIEKNSKSGVYHVAPEASEGEATRYEIAKTIGEYFGIKNPDEFFVKELQRNIFKTPRPPSSAIKNTKLPQLANWKDSLHAYLELQYGKHRKTYEI